MTENTNDRRDATGDANANDVNAVNDDEDLLISTHRHGDVVRVEARGDIDLFTASRFSEALEEACSSHCGSQNGQEQPESTRNILVDLRCVSFIDSAGLAVMVHLRRQNEALCKMTLVIEPGTQPERVIRLSRFDTFFPIVNSLNVLDSADAPAASGLSYSLHT
jgi:anti-anti-sigma factor